MKILGFAQLGDELEKGNLENWFKCMSACDEVYIFDQKSTDGSQEFYKSQDYVKANVIYSDVDRFGEEGNAKAELFEKMMNEHPDVDWILWMDGDTMLDGRLIKNNGEKLQELCENKASLGVDCVSFGHFNLWRSDIHYRLDAEYHGLHGNVKALWRNNGNLHYPKSTGHHGAQFPDGMNEIDYAMTNEDDFIYSLVHRGFATDYQIMRRYHMYKGHGQEGWNLERLLFEETLEVNELPSDILPEWFNVEKRRHPVTKRKIIDIYKQKHNL